MPSLGDLLYNFKNKNPLVHLLYSICCLHLTGHLMFDLTELPCIAFTACEFLVPVENSFFIFIVRHSVAMHLIPVCVSFVTIWHIRFESWIFLVMSHAHLIII